MHFDQLERREFIIVLDSAAGWLLAVCAQQGERKLGMLMRAVENDAESRDRIAALREGTLRSGMDGMLSKRHNSRRVGQTVKRECTPKDCGAIDDACYRASVPCFMGWVLAGSRAGNTRAARRLRERRHALVP
jgi:hypothetical protein